MNCDSLIRISLILKYPEYPRLPTNYVTSWREWKIFINIFSDFFKCISVVISKSIKKYEGISAEIAGESQEPLAKYVYESLELLSSKILRNF